MSATAARHQRLPMPLSGRGRPTYAAVGARPPDLCRCRGGVARPMPLSGRGARPSCRCRGGIARPMPLSGRDARPCRRYRQSPFAPPPTLTRPHVGSRSVPADVLIRRADPYATLLGPPSGRPNPPHVRDQHRPSHGCEKWSGGGHQGGRGKSHGRNPRHHATVCAGQTGCRLVELRGFEPRAFSLRRRSRPHRSPVYALHELCADRHGAPVPSAGGTGGARQSLPGGRAWSPKRFDHRTLCPLEAAFRPRRAVSDRHVHDLRRRPTSRCHFVPLIQPVPTRPHRFRQISHRLLPHHPRG